MFKLLILFHFITSSLLADTYIRADQKTQNNDLRSFKNMFEIRSLEKKNLSYKLNVINSDQYIIIYGDNDESLRISSLSSEKIDNKFVSEFIKMKYSMTRSNKSICYEAYELVMRGEKQKICSDEINKLRMLKVITDELEALRKEDEETEE